MIFFEKNKRLVPVAVVIVIYLILGALVYGATREDYQIKVVDKEQRVADDDAETHPARAYLVVDNGLFSQEYYARLTNTTTFMMLLDHHRENSGLTFKKIGYTYGITLDNVNNYLAPSGYSWNLYDNDEDITYKASGLKLQNEHIYTIRLEKAE